MLRSLLALSFSVLGLAPSSAADRSLLDYAGQDVPFARAASGVQIYGDAWT